MQIQLDQLKRHFDDYFHNGDYFEGSNWVKKNRPIFNTGNLWFYTFRRPHLINVKMDSVSGDWNGVAVLIREKIAHCDGIPSKYRKAPRLTRNSVFWDFWWIEDVNKDNDYRKWLIPRLPLGHLYTFKT
jgi:hypothetical protein